MKVSVIIPTYNRADALRSAVSSVLNQTFQDFEIIVVDDASKDHTAEIVQGFGDRRIGYIRHKTNKKVAGARNTGVLNSKGKYIAFLDDDDEWVREKLERQVDLLDNSPPVVGGVYTGFLKIDRANGKTLFQVVPAKRGNIFRDLLIENWVGTSTLLIRKECFEKVGMFDESVFFGEDWDMWIQIAKEFHFEYIRDALVNYYVHDTKLSTNYRIMIEGREALVRKYAVFLEADSKSYSRHYLDIGIFYCHLGSTTEGRKAFFKAIKLYPFEARHYFNLCLSLLGPSNFRRLKKFRDTYL